MAPLRFGPAEVPSRKSPAEAVRLLREQKFNACEIDFAGGFWMDYEWAEEFGKLARTARIVLSVHAPIAGFMGHLERDKKFRMAVGMLDHSAGIAVAASAKLVVFHPGFLLGRTRRAAISAVSKQLEELRARLEGKGRVVPFGIEVMGRVREIGSLVGTTVSAVFLLVIGLINLVVLIEIYRLFRKVSRGGRYDEQNLEDFLKVSLDYFHPTQLSFTRMAVGELLEGLLRRRRVHPHDLPAVAVEVEEAA